MICQESGTDSLPLCSVNSTDFFCCYKSDIRSRVYVDIPVLHIIDVLSSSKIQYRTIFHSVTEPCNWTDLSTRRDSLLLCLYCQITESGKFYRWKRLKGSHSAHKRLQMHNRKKMLDRVSRIDR